MPKLPLTTTLIKRNVVGKRHFHTFNQLGSAVMVPCTESEYLALALPNASPPTLAGAVWEGSSATDVYDTLDGNLGEAEYAERNADWVAVRLNNQINDFRSSEIKNNRLTAEAILKAQAFGWHQ